MAAVFPTTPVDIIGFTHKKKHTASCLKKITGEAMSLRWQSSTMCSSSLSSCCTSWTWCSFQPCPVGNQPVFSLAVCLCVCVMLSSYVVPSFQRHKLPVLGPPAWIGHRDSVWHARMNATLILYQNATNATPKACLLDNWAAKRGPLFTFLVLLLPLFSFLIFFLSFFLFKGKQSKCQPESKVSTIPSFSFTEKFCPFYCLLISRYLSFLPCFFLSISVMQYNYTHKNTNMPYSLTHYTSYLQLLISYLPTWGPSSLGPLLRVLWKCLLCMFIGQTMKLDHIF